MTKLLASLLLTLGLPVLAQAATFDLYSVYAEAIAADPRVRIAQHRVEMGKAQADSAFGALLPQANLTGNWSDNDVSFDSNEIEDRDYNGKRYGIQVRQTLFNWSALSARARTEQVRAQREAELLDVMSILLLDISERYFSVLLAERDLEITRAEKTHVGEQLEQAEEKFERKLIRITDYLETQARMDAVRTSEIDAENRVALARESLFELTGTSIGELAPLREGFTLPELDGGMNVWTERAMNSNSLLRAKREAVLAAREGVEEAKGGHLPKVDLVFSDQTSDTGYDNQQQPERDTQYIAIDVNVPLFSGGSTSARIREAWAAYYIAREEEEGSRRQVLKRSREAWLNTQAGRRRIESSALSVRSATKSLDAMNKSFSYGTVTSADVLEALAMQTRARRDHQEALHGYIYNWLALKRESGQLEETDLVRVNSWLQPVSQ